MLHTVIVWVLIILLAFGSGASAPLVGRYEDRFYAGAWFILTTLLVCVARYL